jgi:hypothetical protein
MDIDPEHKKAILDAMVKGEGGDLLQAQAVSDDGYDKTADSRKAPEVKIKSITSRLGSVVIHGMENDVEVEKQITIDEAILRCNALLEMVKQPWKYKSDMNETRRILEMFVNAVSSAKHELSAAGFSHGVRV